MKNILLILLFLLPQTSFARLLLDISLINKKGIDIGLTLGSELHSSEEVVDTKPIKLELKSGLELELQVKFSDAKKNLVGPPHEVQVDGILRSDDGKKIEDFFKEPIISQLGELKKISYTIENQQIDLSFRAYVK